MTKSREAAEQAIARAAAAQARDPNPHGLAPAQIQALHERYALSMPQLVSARPSNRISKFFDGIMPPGATFTAADDMARTAASRRGMLPGGAMLTGTGGNGIMTSPQLPYQPEFACFRAGTQVLLPDGTRKPIEEIRIGDRILDRTGRIQVVENAWCSGIPSEVVEVVTWGKKTFYSTLQHSWPVWSWVRTCQCGCGADVTPGRLYKSGHYKGGTQGDACVHVRGTKARTGKGYQAIPVNYEPLQRMRAEALRAGDFLLMPRKFDAVTTDVSETEARLLGYYTAEGTIDKSRDGLPEAVSFDFGKHEIATWVRDVQDLASSLGIKVSTSLKKSCCHVRTTNDRGQNDAAKRLVALAAMHVGEYSDKKRFSEEVMRWPVKLKRELIRGMFRGDGTQNWRISTKNGHEGRAFGVTYTTVSRTLVDQLQLILAQIGWPSRLTSAQATSRMFPDGKTRECLKAFHLTIPAPFAFDAADFIWGDSSQARRFERREEIRPECMLDDDFVYLPIKSVTRVSNDVPVYNLTVSGDHSYLVDNVATYNSPARQSFPVHRCLIEGTLVQYASGAVGTIEDVQIGDELLGPDGRRRTVLDWWREEPSKDLIEIEWSNGRKVRCSKTHLWPTTRGDVRADQLEVGDVSLLARKFEAARGSATPELARLAGYYAAEGSIIRNAGNQALTGVKFSLHRDEEDLAADIKRCAFSAFDVCGLLGDTKCEGVSRGDVQDGLRRGRLVVSGPRVLKGTNQYVSCRCDCGNSLDVLVASLAAGNTDSCGCKLVTRDVVEAERLCRSVHLTAGRSRSEDAASKRIARWLAEHVGEGSKEKNLSPTIMHWPVSLKRQFLIGYLRGDGSARVKRAAQHPTSSGREVSFNTTSFSLGWQVNLLLTQCGFVGRMHERSEFRSADGVFHAAKLEWAIGGEQAGELAALIWGSDHEVAQYQPVNARRTVQLDDDFAYVTVRRVESVLNVDRVATYDITVSDDHCFCLAGGLVTHNSLANIYWRLFYKLDPVFQTGVNLISEMIFSKFRITGEGIDGEIHDMLEEQVETTQLHAHLAYFPREFLVVGEVIPHLFFDETRGIWTHLTLHDPDRIEVIWSPFLDMDPILQFRPDDELRKIVLSADPILSPIRDSMPEEVFTAIASGENITLSPINASLLARRMHPYNIRGDSVAAAMWETWMYEDAIRAASIAIARRGACFVAGTPVLTTKGTKAIEDVKIGDRVIAGDGSTQTVEQAWAELKASEGLVEIKALGSPSLFCTPQHRFKIWAAPRTCACGCGTPLEMTYANGKPRRRAFVTGHAGRRNETGQMIAGPTIDWTVYATDPKVRAPSTHQPLKDVEAKDIRKGDYMLVPRKFDQIETSTRLEAARMLGYYVAEGSRRNITKNGEVRCEGVALTFSLAEAETWGRDVMQLASALGLDPILTEYRPSESTVTASSGREGRTVIYLQKQKDEHFAHWLRTHGGEGSENMCLSEEVMRWPLDLKREFLRGYFRGDGHWGIPDADSPRCLQVTAASTSQSLIYQIRILLAQIGVYGSVSYNPRKHANWNDVWIVSSTGRDARLLANLFWGVRVDPLREEGSGSRTWVDEDYVYVPVQKVERHDDDVVTYNLTVSGDHSYLAGGLQTFNSPLKVAKLGDPATGYIPSPEQEARLMELLAASETDPNCFTPETPVTLADGSHKPIGDVEVGDLVRDRNGKVSEVTAAWSEVSDELVRIHVVGSGKIDCTPRHRWPVWRTPDVCQCGCETPITRGNFAPNHGMTGLGAPHRYWRPDAAPHKINGVKVRLLEGYDPHCEVTADQLRRGDYLKLPRRFRESRPHDVTADKARLLGYYAAEGSIREIYRRADGSVRLGFDLSFGLPEKDDVVEDAVAVIERVVGFPAYVNPIPERNGIQVASLRNESTPVAEWLRQHAGSMAQAKALSAEVMSWPLDLKYEFLRGYLGGDGCIVQSKDRQGYVEVGSASETLIDQVRLIVTQLGSLASKSWRRQSEKSFGPGNLFYRLHIYGELADRLSKDVWEREPLPRQKSRSTFWWADDDYVYAPVRKVERVTKPGAAFRVVNISVAGDHSYCVHGGVGTFNSWLVYNYAINFDLVGAQERSWKIEQSAEYVERMKLIALGISKSFLWGEISHASAASGLAVFLKRMRAMRDYFESSWLIPKFFKPISVMNKWIKPTEAELKHNVRVRRSFREVVEDRRYITPRIEWENSLDPSVDSAMIQAMQQLEGIGVKFSRTTKMALVNRDFQTELRQRVEESRYEQETLAANPDLALDGGGGAEGGGGGGGGMLPGMPPEALGLPPMEEGAPPEMGGEMPPEPPPASKQSDEGGETAALWDADGRYGSWTKEDATALRQLFRGEVPDDAPWQRMVESWKAKATTDPAARASLLALRLEDTAELWSGVQDWLLVEGYPPEALRQLVEIAASEGLIKVTAAAPDNIPEQFQSDTWLVGMPLKG